MQRLCGRPGCSEPASVAYGMRPEDLVFWLQELAADADTGTAVLCRRHADSMVVPRGWTLDDLRDPHLHLFRPPLPAPAPRARTPRRPREQPAGEQLRLGTDPLPPPAVHVAGQAGQAPDEARPDPSTPHTATPDAHAADTSDDRPAPWSPQFDEADDLDGLLSAHSPLLSRAFRTADRAQD